jgi:hypothetical protein
MTATGWFGNCAAVSRMNIVALPIFQCGLDINHDAPTFGALEDLGAGRARQPPRELVLQSLDQQPTSYIAAAIPGLAAAFGSMLLRFGR